MPHRKSICALVGARNEAHRLKVLLPLLYREGIDCVLIDNASSDDTALVAREFRGRPILFTLPLAYPGHLAMGMLLEAKYRIIQELHHDWVVSQDADEILEHCDPQRGLRAAIEEADAEGYTAINFDEFCFVPEPDADYANRDYHSAMRRYYFFEPSRNRLNRAWRRDAGLDNRASMGHVLTGQELRIARQNHSLRHYPVLSQQHAWEKYLGRHFAQEELAAGFHGNRVGLTREQLVLPTNSPWLRLLIDGVDQRLSRAAPTRLHYWDWGDR